jgi:hypothetical protein
MKESGPLLGPRPIALLAYDYPFGQWSVACELADPLAPVELPRVIRREGRVRPLRIIRLVSEGGMPYRLCARRALVARHERIVDGKSRRSHRLEQQCRGKGCG